MVSAAWHHHLMHTYHFQQLQVASPSYSRLQGKSFSIVISQPQGPMAGGSSTLKPLVGCNSVSSLGFFGFVGSESSHAGSWVSCSAHLHLEGEYALKPPVLSPYLLWCIAPGHPDGLQRWRLGAKTGLTLV